MNDMNEEKELTECRLEEYERHLYMMEKSSRTIEKYMRDVRHFLTYAGDSIHRPQEGEAVPEKICRELVLDYKEYLIGAYKISSVNSMLISLNGYLRFIGRSDCCIKLCRMQRQIFREEEKELSLEEYRKLVWQAEKNGNLRLSCILQTVASTGIRIGELKYIMVESLSGRVVCIHSKGKTRNIILPNSLAAMLQDYCCSKNIRSGSIFITGSGSPVDRRNIWAEMKRLCKDAGVSEHKVFPHNLRHLFARCYYEKEKDIIRLADYLGHSSVETTRRYTMITSMEACQRKLELGMLAGEFSEMYQK